MLYLKFLSGVSFEALDFIESVNDYWLIEQHSSSLAGIDRQRLIKLIDFLEKSLRIKNILII